MRKKLGITHQIIFAAWLAWLVLLVVVSATNAQDANGRFCVRLFEDANNNTVQEAGEPSVTQGIAADLRARGSEVILQSILIQNAPDARRGEICFDNLELGQYEIQLTSASYEIPAGDNTVFTELTETQPVIISVYGVAPRPVSQTSVDRGDDDVDRDEVLERALVSFAGSLVAMAIVAFIGIIVYVVMLRPRQTVSTATGPYYPPPEDARYRRPDTRPTGEHRTVSMDSIDPLDDTGEHNRAE